MTECWSEGELRAYCDRELPAKDMDRLAAHLENCVPCRERLGITTAKRSPLLPDVPPIAETLQGYEVTLWNGLLAPAKTPPEIIDRINRAAIDALRSRELRAKLAEQGSEPVGNTPVEFKSFIGSELVKWRRLVEISGAAVQ